MFINLQTSHTEKPLIPPSPRPCHPTYLPQPVCPPLPKGHAGQGAAGQGALSRAGQGRTPTAVTVTGGSGWAGWGQGGPGRGQKSPGRDLRASAHGLPYAPQSPAQPPVRVPQLWRATPQLPTNHMGRSRSLLGSALGSHWGDGAGPARKQGPEPGPDSGLERPRSPEDAPPSGMGQQRPSLGFQGGQHPGPAGHQPALKGIALAPRDTRHGSTQPRRDMPPTPQPAPCPP